MSEILEFIKNKSEFYQYLKNNILSSSYYSSSDKEGIMIMKKYLTKYIYDERVPCCNYICMYIQNLFPLMTMLLINKC